MESKNQGSEDSPVFVVGVARSGTTLLRVMLDSHPDLAIPYESTIIPKLWARRNELSRTELMDLILESKCLRLSGISRQAIIAKVEELHSPSFADIIRAVFVANAQQHQKTRWGDKTPRYVEHIPLLASLFPSARFLHIIRDGRDVVLSLSSLLDVWPWVPQTVSA